jgi:thiamine pyrophosphate-dependent acetolactate synthase large subunit-like protein
VRDNCGGLEIQVTVPAELSGALSRAIAHEGPSLVEVMTDPQLI